jgi:hypothetical protein
MDSGWRFGRFRKRFWERGRSHLEGGGVVDPGVAECQGSRRGYGVLTVFHCLLVVRSSRLTTHCCSVSLPLIV